MAEPATTEIATPPQAQESSTEASTTPSAAQEWKPVTYGPNQTRGWSEDEWDFNKPEARVPNGNYKITTKVGQSNRPPYGMVTVTTYTPISNSPDAQPTAAPTAPTTSPVRP